ncbi:hypothetical protein [Rhodococcus koreensis]|uniref:Uncharacterized protein n=1 Tax=Rhodococcus koreensis TaxID=99653 RepID=A0A1H4M3L4_9NOCA|nr:hypothetical protein [Rhodococcus koreensis]SEB77700.1 hypothetical protein SAMN04490239_1618 [Rhodococcus koreensis]
MRVTPITALRGRILHCTDCGRWCRVSALRAGEDRCPGCERCGLLVAGTGQWFAPERHSG